MPSFSFNHTKHNSEKGKLVISKVTDIDDLSKRISSYIKSGIKPLEDADKFYQAHRGVRS